MLNVNLSWLFDHACLTLSLSIVHTYGSTTAVIVHKGVFLTAELLLLRSSLS